MVVALPWCRPPIALCSCVCTGGRWGQKPLLPLLAERPTTRDPAREARCQYPAAIHFRANPRLDKTPPLSRALPGGFGALRDRREDRGITAATCPDAY